MSVIKSSFEIAMERTKSIEANKESLEVETQIKEGKRLASLYLDHRIEDLPKALREHDKKSLKWVEEGVLQALLSNLTLAQDEFGFKKNRKVGEALFAIVDESRKLGKLLSELERFFKEYLEESKRLTEAAETQYAPKLRQKEDEMSKQLGTPVKLEPSADPEFQAFLRRNISALEERYNAVLREAKDEIRKIFESKH